MASSKGILSLLRRGQLTLKREGRRKKGGKNTNKLPQPKEETRSDLRFRGESLSQRSPTRPGVRREGSPKKVGEEGRKGGYDLLKRARGAP